MPVIETTVGSVTTRGKGSLDISCYYRKDKTASELVLIEAEKDPKCGIQSVGHAEVFPSGVRMTNKKWITKRNEYPNGSLLRLNLRHTIVGMGFGVTIMNLVIRARDEAALNEIAVICPTDENSSRSRVYVIGRFDILSPTEVSELGLDVAKNGNDISHEFPELSDMGEFIDVVEKEREISKPNKARTGTIGSGSGARKVVLAKVKRRVHLPARK